MTMKVESASEDDLLPTSGLADDIVVNAEEEEDAGILADRLDKSSQGTRWSKQDESDDK